MIEGLPAPAALAAGLAVLFLAFIVKGLSSFGPALVSVPLLGILWQDAKLFVPLLACVNIVVNAAFLYHLRHSIKLRPLLWLGVGTVCGTPIGTHLLEVLSPEIIRIAIAVVVLTSVVALSWGKRNRTEGSDDPPWRRRHAVFACGAGVIAGITGGAVAIDGPPCVLYLAATVRGKDARYATILAVFMVSAVARIGFYATQGTLQFTHLVLCLYALPVVALGTWVGWLMYRRLSEASFDHVVLTLLVFSAASLLINVFL